ncbi:transposase [Methylobacter sp. S3L5C]|nr:transposase [Methylobacter sp. S3L5C]
MTIERLPAFSPDYNPIEKLWKNTKRVSTHMKYFKTVEDLYDSVITTFKTYLQDASKVLCVMKKCARILRLLGNTYRGGLEIIYLRNYRCIWWLCSLSFLL